MLLQASAMVEMMIHYNWTYISVLFSEGSYGENGGKQVERSAKKRGICIAYSKMLNSDITYDEMTTIIHRLRQAKARVVVLFMDSFHHPILLQHPDLLTGRRGEFIFIGSDFIAGRDYGSVFDGGIVAFFPFSEQPGK